MAYPSTVSAFTNPTPTDKLNSPSHSSIETAQNTGLTELQTFVGTESSLVGTLMYDIRGANSNGGGHVQAVNKGGTGQTAYTKGDILVATSASVLAKLTAGSDAQILTADSSVAGGLKWAANPTAFSNKIATSGASQTIGQSKAANSDQSVLSVTISGSVLASDQAIRATVFVSNLSKNLNAGSVLLAARYGANTIASVLLQDNISPSLSGVLTCDLIANSSSVLQRGNMYLDLKQETAGIQGNNGVMFASSSVFTKLRGYTTGTSSVNASADQTLGITVRFQDNSAANEITIKGYTIEKIA